MLFCNFINALDIGLDIELALAAVVVHEADFAKHCSLCPALHESDKPVSSNPLMEVKLRRHVDDDDDDERIKVCLGSGKDPSD